MVKIDDIADLRRGIDYIGVTCSFIIHDGEGRILLQKRGKGARDENGRWDIGGGAIEFGETFEETIRREIKEELCTDPLEIKFVSVYDAHRYLDDGTPTHWVAVIFAVKVDPASIRIGEPHKIDEIGWFTAHDLPKPLHSMFHKSFAIATKHGIIK